MHEQGDETNASSRKRNEPAGDASKPKRKTPITEASSEELDVEYERLKMDVSDMRERATEKAMCVDTFGKNVGLIKEEVKVHKTKYPKSKSKSVFSGLCFTSDVEA